MRLRTWLFNNFREVSCSMAFEEVDFPVLESEVLFVHKAGEEITQQLFLTYYSSCRVVLRPAITPFLAGLVIKQGIMDVPCITNHNLELGKLIREEIEELILTGLSTEAVQGIIEVLSLKSLSKLEEVLGSGVEAVADLKRLFSFAEQYGYADWICFDASVVRGLVYYTRAFGREGELRAICSGGRYDRLLSTFGSEDIPACGFGFGDAVIVELLKENCLLPDSSRQIDDIVFPLDEELEEPSSSVASSPGKKGRSVDLVEDKRLKWVFQHAERINATRLILVGKSEWGFT